MDWQDKGFSVGSAFAKGRKLPSWLDKEIHMSTAEMFYLKAFWDLNTCRNVGMGIGPIPWTAIKQYSDSKQLDLENEDCFIYVMRQMDDAYVARASKKEEKKPTGG